MDELRLFSLNLYGTFRCKEFVRAYMGSGKKSLELGIRQTTVVVSNPDRTPNDSDVYIKMKEVMKETVLESSLDINDNFTKTNKHNNQPRVWSKRNSC